MTTAIITALIVGAVEVIAGGGMTPERIAELRLIYRCPTLGRASMNEALDEIERLTDECAATRSDFANALSRHAADQAETERLRTELRDCLVIVANAGRAQGTAEAMCDTLEQRCQEAEREVERLNIVNDQRDALKDRVAELEAEQEEKGEELVDAAVRANDFASMKSRVSAQDEQIKYLSAERDALKVKLADAEADSAAKALWVTDVMARLQDVIKHEVAKRRRAEAELRDHPREPITQDWFLWEINNPDASKALIEGRAAVVPLKVDLWQEDWVRRVSAIRLDKPVED